MFRIFFIIFFFGFILLSLLGFSVVRSFKEFFFGNPKNKQRATSQNRQSSQSKSSTNRQKQSRKKVISADEGEYVDYEEVKD